MSAFDIDPTTWATLDRLLDDALDLAPEERERWLEELAPEHRALGPRLRSLLEHAASDASSDPLLGPLPKLHGLFDETSGQALDPMRPSDAAAEERLRAAEATFQRSPERSNALSRSVALEHPEVRGTQDLRLALNVAIRVALAQEDFRGAEEMATRLLDVSESVARDPRLSGHVGRALVFRAKARLGTGDVAAARRDLERGLPSLEKGLGVDHRETVEARELLERLERSP